MLTAKLIAINGQQAERWDTTCTARTEAVVDVAAAAKIWTKICSTIYTANIYSTYVCMCAAAAAVEVRQLAPECTGSKDVD